MINKVLDYQIFKIGSYDLDIGQILNLVVLLIFASVLWRLTKAKWRIDFFNTHQVEPLQRRRLEKYLRQLIILVTTFYTLKVLNLDFILFQQNQENTASGVTIRYSIFLVIFIALVFAWVIEWYFSNILIKKYEQDRKDQSSALSIERTTTVRKKINKLLQYIIVVLALIGFINKLGWNSTFYSITTKNNTFSLSVNRILLAVLVILMARLFVWVLTEVIIYGYIKRKNIDQGGRFAINQILKYVIYTIAAIFALNFLGINMTLILGGAAALLVGIGLGLQQTFNDFFSGLVLLFERTVSVGDVLEVDDHVGTVKKIGIRSSIIETRAFISHIVPNSKLVNQSVKNWTHRVSYGRFEITVGVAYGSDTALVKKQLLAAVLGQKDILEYPSPFVRFLDFADSSLNFKIYFFSRNFIGIEDIKSDIRFRIDENFRKNNISMPFPQRDVWIKNAE